MSAIETDEVQLAGYRVFVRRTRGAGTPTVFVHGVPTHSAEWVAFMDRIDGPAVAPDLIGFGRSSKPKAFDYGMDGIAGLLGKTLDQLGIADHNLVVHDWGVVGLIAALRRPESVKRLVIVNAVPLLAGYRWHWVARMWRTRGLGELFNATTTKFVFRTAMRQARPRFRAMPADYIESIWGQWDHGTRRAVLGLYRSADPDRLAAAGRNLSSLGCPALVIWGCADPYLPARFGEAYASRLPDAELLLLDDAGHWPWIDRPEVIDRVSGFLNASA